MGVRFVRPVRFLLFLFSLGFGLGTVLDPTLADKPGAASMPEPKVVRWPSEKLPFSKALAEVVRQTGIAVEDMRGVADESIHLPSREANFWQALDALAEAGKAQVTLYPTSGRIFLGRRGPHYQQPPISYDGRFRLRLTRATLIRNLDVREGAAQDGAIHLAVEVAWDPDLLPLYLETRPQKVRLIDEDNHALTLPEEGSSLAPVDGKIAQEIDLALPLLPRHVKTIQQLTGELAMIGPSKMLMFTFDRLDRLTQSRATDPERQLMQEDVTCRILDIKLLRDHWTIRVGLDYPPMLKPLDTNQSWVVNNEMALESLDGKKRLLSTSYALETATPRHAVVSYHFQDRSGLQRGKPGDWRVRYRTPANLIEVPIRFAFKNIPLR